MEIKGGVDRIERRRYCGQTHLLGRDQVLGCGFTRERCPRFLRQYNVWVHRRRSATLRIQNLEIWRLISAIRFCEHEISHQTARFQKWHDRRDNRLHRRFPQDIRGVLSQRLSIDSILWLGPGWLSTCKKRGLTSQGEPAATRTDSAWRPLLKHLTLFRRCSPSGRCQTSDFSPENKCVFRCC